MNNFTEFFADFRKEGHREATCVLVESVAGQTMALDEFTALYKKSVGGVHCAPSKVLNLFRFLVKHGIISEAYG